MLDPEQKLYQLIINRLDGEKLSSGQYQESVVELVRKGIGGFILFGGKKDEVKSFVARLQSISEIPLFIASDIERGAGQQFEGATRFPCQMAFSAAISRDKDDDVKILRDAIHAIAAEAIDTGINMPLIPVLDVNRNPDNPIICTRAFSDDPAEVAWYGKLYIRLLEESGLICCAKHFPGHGDTSIDSHIALPVISKSLKELKETDLFPFMEAIKAGVPGIMIGHLSIPMIDTWPASLSKKIVTGLLREELGYDGLILTDALNMSALKEVENAPVKCINAGADILLHPSDADAVVNELKQAVSSGGIEERNIDIATARILKYKSKMLSSLSAKGGWGDFVNHAELSQKIFDKSITLVKDTHGLMPLRWMRDVRLVFAGDENFHKTSPLGGLVSDSFSISAGTGLEGQPLRAASTTVFAVFTNVAAWKGSSGISEKEIHGIKELMKKSHRSVVISFGSPYVLRHFTDADALIAAYDTAGQAQESVVKCLKGEREFQGRLPVQLKI
jgi:beta-glucosidase-like glycosyl hydrolase